MRAFVASWLVPSALLLGSLVLACTSAGTSSGNGGPPGASSGDGGDGGSSGSSGSSGGEGGAAGALPASTFLYVSAATADHDILMAYDGTTGESRTVTDLRSDGSDGWEIGGYAISPDRTRIAIASLYAPTKEDNDTKLATRRIYSFAVDGSDPRRLTPVFENTGAGRKQFVLEIRNPFFSRSGADILYNYGEYWYEGTTLEGGSGIWSVSAAGGLPNLFKAPNPCTFVDPSVDPKTGKVVMLHSVCIPGQGQDGIYLYPEDGKGTPEKLVGSDGTLDVVLEPPRWVGDGSGFLFVAVGWKRHRLLPERGRGDQPPRDRSHEESADRCGDHERRQELSPRVVTHSDRRSYVQRSCFSPSGGRCRALAR
jgi:hypothetical protein